MGRSGALRGGAKGGDAVAIDGVWRIAYRGGFDRGGAVLLSALSGLDQALWEVKGRSLGVPVWQLLGGKSRNRIAVYAWIGGDHPHEVGEGARTRFIPQAVCTCRRDATAPGCMIMTTTAGEKNAP